MHIIEKNNYLNLPQNSNIPVMNGIIFLKRGNIPQTLILEPPFTKNKNVISNLNYKILTIHLLVVE